MRSPAEAIQQFLIERTPDPSVKCRVLAVSGGVDSIVLLHAAVAQQPARSWIVAHFDHALRDGASAADAEFVRQQAEALSLAFVCDRRDPKRTGTSEADLRGARRAFLERVCRESGAGEIWTAHHLDDQFETFWLRLLRGSTLTGLTCMRPKTGLWIKPFLALPKQQLIAYADEHRLTYREDASNATTDYLRNRIRHVLTPVVRELAGSYGGMEAFLGRFSETLQEMGDVDRLIDSLLTLNGPEADRFVVTPMWVRMPLPWLAGLDPILQARTIRKAGVAAGAGPLERSMIERVMRAVHSKSLAPQRISMGQGYDWVQSCGFAYLKKLRPPALSFERVGNAFHCQTTGIEIQLSSELEPSAVQARFFRPGDRLRVRKLKKQMLDRRLPSPEREIFPVLVDLQDQSVIWTAFQNGKIGVLRCDYPYLFSAAKSP